MYEQVYIILREARSLGEAVSPLWGFIHVEVFSPGFFVLACFFDAFWVWFDTGLILFCYGSA